MVVVYARAGERESGEAGGSEAQTVNLSIKNINTNININNKSKIERTRGNEAQLVNHSINKIRQRWIFSSEHIFEE